MEWSLVVDGLLAVLLLVTLIYVARLHKRLGQLRDSRQEFETLIARFTQATEQADRSLANIKAAAAAEGQELQATVDRSRGLREDLAFMVDKATGLADQLEASISRARTGGQRPPVVSSVVTSTAPSRDRPSKDRPPEASARRAPQRPAEKAEGGPMSSEERELLEALASIR
jgi:ABC-type transporter Mla subunit MlaD